MRIVAVEPNSDLLLDLTQNLHTAFPGSEVAIFTNPLEVLKDALEHPINLLFTDVRLYPFDGYELIKALQQRQQFFAYVVSGTREHPDDLSWMNVNGCFAKPITLDELISVREQLSSKPLGHRLNCRSCLVLP